MPEESKQQRFNSTIVRLKHMIAGRKLFTEKRFNSTIVRLKRYPSPSKMASDIRFNSTIVRLKQHRRGGGIIRYHVFQFYNSPIKTDYNIRVRFETTKFQFYNSPIKTR